MNVARHLGLYSGWLPLMQMFQEKESKRVHSFKGSLGELQSMGSLRVGARLSDFTFTFHFHALEKKMAAHSSVLAWRIPGTGEPGGLPSVG